MDKFSSITKVNELASQAIPFILLVDFEMEDILVKPLSELGEELKYDFSGAESKSPSLLPKLAVGAHSFFDYYHAFDHIMDEIKYGNTFLTNLTCKVPIKVQASLQEIYKQATAKYKVYMKDRFVSFSPETFVKIKDSIISTYPMKGTINASEQNAREKLLEDKKELAEHYTIVDLLRNDLSINATQVTVEEFRYIDKISSNNKDLLQASSKITGRLANGYLSKLGDIIFSMLPAGSISGAPKKKTIDIIKNSEHCKRGYYTGICGVFDGRDFDSCVLIRFIETDNGQFYYRTGGGLTFQSEVEKEYQELLDKIYIPLG